MAGAVKVGEVKDFTRIERIGALIRELGRDIIERAIIKSCNFSAHMWIVDTHVEINNA